MFGSSSREEEARALVDFIASSSTMAYPFNITQSQALHDGTTATPPRDDDTIPTQHSDDLSINSDDMIGVHTLRNLGTADDPIDLTNSPNPVARSPPAVEFINLNDLTPPPRRADPHNWEPPSNEPHFLYQLRSPSSIYESAERAGVFDASPETVEAAAIPIVQRRVNPFGSIGNHRNVRRRHAGAFTFHHELVYDQMAHINQIVHNAMALMDAAMDLRRLNERYEEQLDLEEVTENLNNRFNQEQ